MFDKITSFYNLFRLGQSLANRKAWIMGQITAGMLAAFLMAGAGAVKAFLGIEIPLTQDTANTIAAGLIALAGIVLPLALHDEVGVLPPVRPTDSASPPSDGNPN
jgi:hypothetical protein